MYRAYLSGSMQGRFAEEVKAERAEAVKALAKIGVHAVDPAAAEQRLWGKEHKARIPISMKRRIMETMVNQDLWLIRRSDILLVLTGDTPSDGTWWEMIYAQQEIGIPVIMIAPRRYSGELMGWSTIRIPKDHIVKDLAQACRVIKRKYLKDMTEHRAYFSDAIKNAKTAIVSAPRNKRRLTKRPTHIKLSGEKHGRRTTRRQG